ncbi:MAG: ammonium transporter, Amt family [Actinomycetota bacterium]|nr:ammonium transporter, Amt family [Actinomycetota bacterium]
MPEIDTGDTAWVLMSTALVLLMTPAVAFFYGGMVRMKSVLNMMMMSFGAMALIAVLWVLYGYSFAFGNSVGGLGLLGDPTEFLGLKGLMSEDAISGTIPTMVFVAFQAMFAIITVALISGAIADRAKFGTWMIFAGIWATLVYFPVAHWVFAFDGDDYTGGWIANKLGAIDFAGGTAVHINAGAAGLALAIVLGKRVGFGKTAFRPHNLPFVMLGAGLLWFGWFGFNAGSALAANGTAGIAFMMTVVATAASSLAWMLTERIRDGHATSLGAASGVVAGLVAITPACASVNILGALAIGVAAGVLCALAVGLKYRFGYDDSLDVVGVHLVGGIVGCLMIGLVATEEAPAGVTGLFYGGGFGLLGKQSVAIVAVLAYSLVLTFIIGFLLNKTIGFRVDRDVEQAGVDVNEHAETAYEMTDGYGGSFSGSSVTSRDKQEVSA